VFDQIGNIVSSLISLSPSLLELTISLYTTSPFLKTIATFEPVFSEVISSF
jgi:hypothetical protein